MAEYPHIKSSWHLRQQVVCRENNSWVWGPGLPARALSGEQGWREVLYMSVCMCVCVWTCVRATMLHSLYNVLVCMNVTCTVHTYVYGAKEEGIVPPVAPLQF